MITTRDAIRTEIEAILGEIVLDPSLRLTDEMEPADVLYWVSHNHVRLLLSLAEQFNIKFESQEIASEGTVGDLVNLVELKIAAPPAALDHVGKSKWNVIVFLPGVGSILTR